jgi:pyruvate dehydrogenase E2 component (dihydrolipoamide acetyltransferase)
MSKFEFKLPDIGEGIAEGEIVGWLVKPGDSVIEGQDLVEIMTDKATVTIGAPKSGNIVELGGAVGETIAVGGVLAVFDLPGESLVASGGAGAPPHAPASAADAAEQSHDEGPAASAVGDIRTSLPGIDLASAPGKPSAANSADYYNDRPLAAPATRKLARELGVDLHRIQPSDKSGRIQREDVERMGARAVDGVQGVPAPEIASIAATPRSSGRDEERIPIRGMRKRIFENMARAKRNAAHFTYVDECDASALVALRERTLPLALQAGVKLNYLPFVIRAVVLALNKYPALNAIVDDAAQEIVMRKRHDIGIATSTDAGLIVPVVRDVDRLSLLDIAREIQRLGDAARAGKTATADLGGSSFTVTSLGKLGGLLATPVINYPEVAILSVHEIKPRPVVRGDQIVIGQIMMLSLSFDHRVIDGAAGAAFARQIITILQEPDRLLLGG